MEITGKVEKLMPVEVVWKNQIEKQSFIVTEVGDHPNSLCLDIFGDKMPLLKDVKEWQNITAHFNTKTREYNGRVYNSITAWKIEVGMPVEQTEDLSLWDDCLPF